MDVAILDCYSLPTKNTICGAIAPPILAEVFASPYAVALQNKRVNSGNFGHRVNSDSDLVCFTF